MTPEDRWAEDEEGPRWAAEQDACRRSSEAIQRDHLARVLLAFPPSICEVLLDVFVEYGLHVKPPGGIAPPPIIPALLDAFEAYYAPLHAIQDEQFSQARTFLASIASAKAQGTMEQSEWMIAQAQEGLRRANTFEALGASMTDLVEKVAAWLYAFDGSPPVRTVLGLKPEPVSEREEVYRDRAAVLLRVVRDHDEEHS